MTHPHVSGSRHEREPAALVIQPVFEIDGDVAVRQGDDLGDHQLTGDRYA
jgi:hypothetical protein